MMRMTTELMNVFDRQPPSSLINDYMSHYFNSIIIETYEELHSKICCSATKR